MKKHSYEMRMYFSSSPRPEPTGFSLKEIIFGRFCDTSMRKTEHCQKKYRITVEYIGDEEE